MEQSRLHNFEAQCTQEEPPSCQTMCPLHVDVRAIARLMAQSKHDEARKILDRTMPLPVLMGCLCEGPCMRHCRRAEVDEAVNMPLIERACVAGSRNIKPMILPANGKKALIAGAGLSSLVAAFELAKKSYTVTLLHQGEPGGRIRALPEGRLPANALTEALQMLEDMKVSLTRVDSLSKALLEEYLADGAAVYIGLDDAAVNAPALGIAMDGGTPELDPVTLATQEHPSIFAGGWPGGCTDGCRANGAASFIQEAADGKRAAASMDRLLKGVNPATAREKEGTYQSTLYTDISGVEKVPAISPANPFTPTVEEASAEAARCIQCECLECVKRCAYLAHYKGYPKRYAREMYNNLAVVHGQRRANTQINSCAECGLCAIICPYDADMGAFCKDAKKEMVQTNRMPPRPHEFALLDMEFSNAADVGFFRHQPGTARSAWAFFPGCQLPASMPVHTESTYLHLGKYLVGGVGFYFSCCGAPAKWTGRPNLTADVAAALRKQWEEADRPTFILACSSCSAFFAAELPDIPTRSLWEILEELPLPESARAVKDMAFALHDPCVTRQAPEVQRSVRKITTKLRQKIEELRLGREFTRCCGYGGLASYADPVVGDAYARSRVDDTGTTLLSYCIMCRDRLSLVGGPSLHMLDLLFPQAETSFEDYIEKASFREAPGISSRQENRLSFRRYFLQKHWGEAPVWDPRMESLILNISDAVEALMEERRILRTDVKTVLLHAEEHGALFHNPDTGHTLASLRPKQVSFWVEFSREEDGSYTIHDAYCHRMVVPGVPGEGGPTPCTLEGYSAKGGRM